MIPKELRDRFRLRPGATVQFEERAGGVLTKPSEQKGSLRGRFKGSGTAAELLEERVRERR